MPLSKLLHWVTALALVATLYAHTVLGLDRAVVTPVAGAVAIGALTFGALPYALCRAELKIHGAGRQLAALLGVPLFIYAVGISILHYVDHHPNLRDVGLAVLQLGLPLLTLGQARRRDFLSAIGCTCVCAAVADVIWNGGVLASILPPVSVAQRVTEYGTLTRYPGLSGSTLAAGLVGLIAVARLGGWFVTAKFLAHRLVVVVVALAILADLYLVDSRRYLAEATVAAAILFITPRKSVLPLPIVALAIAAGGLWFTFHSVDPENIQRGNLMIAGWESAKQIWPVGQGPLYREPPAGASYQALWVAGVTESGALSLVISFGLPAAILFFIVCLLALAARRCEATWDSVLLAVLVGDLAFSETLSGFLGAATFFACLMTVILEGRHSSSPDWAPVSAPAT